jgi:hypothetical protein
MIGGQYGLFTVNKELTPNAKNGQQRVKEITPSKLKIKAFIKHMVKSNCITLRTIKGR